MTMSAKDELILYESITIRKLRKELAEKGLRIIELEKKLINAERNAYNEGFDDGRFQYQ